MRLLVVVTLLAGLFVGLTSATLPPVVASHFAAGGLANGYMPRGGYVVLMLVLVVGMPLLLATFLAVTSRLPARYINLPDRDYWLAPERIEETRGFLRHHSERFAVVLAAFLCFVHGLVVTANTRHPPQFPETTFYGGAVVFLVLLIIWIRSFIFHFRR